VPDIEYGGEVRLYDIPKVVLDLTLKAAYDTNGHLKTLTISRNGKEELMYIYYENVEDAQKEIEKFAHENAKCILDKISMCKDEVSRLFIEFFNDGEYMDFHVKLGTETEKAALEKEYPEDEDICDSCSDYSSEILCGDNDRLKVMVSCADNDEFDYFQRAVDIMVQLIEEQAPHVLNKTDDFKLLCEEIVREMAVSDEKRYHYIRIYCECFGCFNNYYGEYGVPRGARYPKAWQGIPSACEG